MIELNSKINDALIKIDFIKRYEELSNKFNAERTPSSNRLVYIDGEEVTPIRANYILRALPIPAGEHTIEFKCVDELMIESHKWSTYMSILVGLVIIGLISLGIYRKVKK